jgi:predicted RNase H-like HicB family nuclease
MPQTLRKRKMSVPDIRFTVQVWKENGKYIAYSPELDVSSFGDSVSHAKTRLREAVTLFLEGALRLGTLEEILSEAGFERHKNTYRPRRVLMREKLRLALPAAS